MARRKQKKNSTFYTLGAIILVVASLLGYSVPGPIRNILKGEQVTSTTQQPRSPKQPPTKSSQQTSSGTYDGSGIEDQGAAKFSKQELKDSQSGWIKYGTLDKLGRATQANALLTKNQVNGGTSANPDIRPTGFISGLSPYFHSRGHLIGRQLGGSGDEGRNLATIYQNPVNTPYMTKYENQVRAALDRGDRVRYQVTPLFKGNEKMCYAVEMQGKSLTSTGKINFHVIIKNEK